ncbi:MAG: hypothetical protein IPQ08_06400 [Chitinophagaceae bacterium]|nr:hypothetical protein [Chitinophagaceae bacterium]
MKIDSEGVKLAFYGIAAIAVFAIGYSLYSKVKNTGGTLSDMGNAIDATINDTIQSVKNTVSNMSDSASGFISQFTGEREYVGSQGKGPYQLTADEYDKSTMSYINAMNTLNKRKAGDISGYKIFSDGTIIDPYGNYKQMRYDTSATETADGFAVADIWNNPRYAFGNIRPMSGDLLEESNRITLQ